MTYGTTYYIIIYNILYYIKYWFIKISKYKDNLRQFYKSHLIKKTMSSCPSR